MLSNESSALYGSLGITAIAPTPRDLSAWQARTKSSNAGAFMQKS
jgi:hypothetical protein